MGGFISTLIRGPICFGFPGYMTFKAIRSGHPHAQTAWLHYWASLGVLLFAEYILAIPFFWLPGYNLIFTMIFVAMAWPQMRATSRIFSLLAPQIAKNEGVVDEKLRMLQAKASSFYPSIEPYVQQAEGLLSKVESMLGERVPEKKD